MLLKSLFTLFLVIFCEFYITEGSVGDQSPFFHKCIIACAEKNCTKANSTAPEDVLEDYITQYIEYFTSVNPYSIWTCKDNCEYDCQWQTVDAFLSRGWDVPQFRGKWPFVRFLGVQEPASFYFSLFNFLANLKLYQRFKEVVDSQSPLFGFWSVHAWVNLNNWVWSSIFHAKDTILTELMDYSCAFFMVSFSMYAMGVRVLYTIAKHNKFYYYIWTVVNVVLFVNHISYMLFVNFDYGYNMMVNIRTGALTLFGWLIWYYRQRKHLQHAWKIALFTILIAVSTLLEVLDFPPILWTFDAHSLWHLSTAFIIYLFYSFIIDDCKYLYKLQLDEAKQHQD